jgi:hypothetical protein
MAKMIAGQAHRGNLLNDEFLYYADMLASLRREEVLVLGRLYRHWQSDSVQRAKENGLKKRAYGCLPRVVPLYVLHAMYVRASGTQER